jgi:hypothetical protein
MIRLITVLTILMLQAAALLAQPDQMVVSTQPGESTAGQVISGPPSVTVFEGDGITPVSGVDVTVSIVGGASFNGGTLTLTTDASGIASFDDLIIHTAGTYSLLFSADDPGVDDVSSADFDIVPDEPDYMEIMEQVRDTLEGYPLAGPPSVRILDQYDNPISGIDITVTLNQNGFTAGSTSLVTSNALGIAVFDQLFIDVVAANYQLSFDADDVEAPGVADISSGLFSILEELAILSMDVQPQHSIAGERIRGYPAVLVLDASTGLPPVSPVNVYAFLSSGDFAAGSTTLAVTNASGIATFNNLIVDDADEDYRILFSAQSAQIAEILSAEFDVIPAAGNLTISGQPQESVEGYPIAGPPAISIMRNDGITPMPGISVTAILNKNSFSSGTVTRITDAEGNAVFDDLVIDNEDTGYQIFFEVAASDSLEGVLSSAFDVVEELATLSITSQPQLSIAGQAVEGPPVVLVTDAATGLPVAFPVNVYATINKGNFAAGSTTMVATGAGGTATFSNLVIDDPDTDYQLVFSTQSSGVADIGSSLFEVIPVSAVMTISTQPQESVETYPVRGFPTVTVLDLFDQPVEGLDVTAVINQNGFAVGSTVTVTTNDQGVALFNNLVIDQVASNYRIRFTTDPAEGVPNQLSNNFNVVTEVAIIHLTIQPQTTLAGQTLNGPPTITLLTPGGVPVQGASISATLNKNNFSVGSTLSVTTNASGVAVFSNLVIDDADTDYQITFSAGTSGVADQASALFDVLEPLGYIEITQQALETVNGETVEGPPTIVLKEPNGDPWSGAEVTITVSINKNGFSSGTLSKLTVGGEAVFDDLILNATASDYTLSFSADLAERISPATSDVFAVVPVSGHLNVSVQPSETVAGDPINGPPQVRLTNLSGNGVPGVTISVSLNKNDFNPSSVITAVTNAGGYASFSQLVIDDFDTGYFLRFTAVGASGIAGVNSSLFEVTDASLTMDVTVQPGLSTAGNSIAGPPQVSISNGGGPVEGVVVTAYISMNSFDPASTLTATTNALGQATFSNLIINTAGLGYTITFNADYSGVPNAISNSFDVVAAAPSYISVVTQPQNTEAGQVIQVFPSAAMYDAFGNPVSGQEISVTANQNDFSAGTVSVFTNAGGIAVFDDLVISIAAANYQLFFTAPAVTTGNSVSFSITNAPAHSVFILTQPSQTVAGAAISGPPEIRVEDEFTNPVQGETVTVSEAGGTPFDGGTLTQITPAGGELSFSDLVINTTGTGYQLRFQAGAVEATSVPFEVVPGTTLSRYYGGTHSGFTQRGAEDLLLGQTPTRIEVIVQPGETVVGTEVSGPPMIIVYDALDSPVSGASVTVSGALFSGGITTRSSGANGEISFPGLVIDVTGTYTLDFTLDTDPLVTASSSPFEVSDPLASMHVSVQPQLSIAGQAVAGYPAVVLQNSIEMPLPGVSIQAYINQHAFAGGSVTVATTDANGRAEFDQLILNTAAGGYQIIFDADYPAVLNILSESFTVTNAPAQQIYMLTQPGETLSGSVLAGPPAVLVRDAFGNPVSGVAVSVSELLAGVINSGTTTITTNSLGMAVFSDLVINSTGTYQLEFTSSGVLPATSSTFRVVSGSLANRFRGQSHSGFNQETIMNQLLGQIPVRIEITRQPLETVAGFLVEGPPGVVVYDALDQPVSNVQVTVSLSSGSFSGGTLTRTTNASGAISFNNLVIDTPGTYQLSFRADNHTGTVSDQTSASFEVVSQIYFMQIESQPQNSVAGSPIAGPPVISITNFIYQPLPGVDVTVYVNQNGFVSGTYTRQTDAFGEIVFDDLVINQAAAGYQLIFDADYSGISNASSGLFTVSHAPANQIQISTQPGTSVLGAVLNGPPSVLLTDAFGNPVPSTTVSVFENGGYSFDAGTTSRQTGPDGEIAFDDLIIQTIGQYTLRFESPGVPETFSLGFNVISGNALNRFLGNTHSGFISDGSSGNQLGQTPSRIEILDQPSETVVGFPIEGPPRIVLYDQADNTMAGVDVTVSTPSGFSGGTLSLTTGSNGEIVFSDLVIDITGFHQLTFQADLFPAVSAVSAEFEVVNQQLFLSMVNQPGLSIAGQTLSGPPSVRLTNSIGQGIPGVSIQVFINQNSFSSPPASRFVTTNATGHALFSDLVIDIASTGYQLIFDADFPGVTNLSSQSFSVVAAAPDQLSVTSQPADSESGAVIGGLPAVVLRDAFGNPVPGISVTVAEAGGYPFDAGTVSRTTSSAGDAVFDDLIINTTGEYRMNFSTAGVPDVSSNPFRILSSNTANRFRGNTHSGFIQDGSSGNQLGQTPTRIEVVQQPAETVSGTIVEGPPRVIVYDELDQPMAGVSVGVSGAVFSSGTSTRLSDAVGEINFNDLVIDNPGTYQLTFTASLYPSVTAVSAPFEVVNPLLSLQIQTQPGETVAGAILAGPPAVRLVNPYGQGFAGVNITVYLNQNSFSSAPATQTVVTNASGVAVFSGLTIDIAATGYQLIFDADFPGVANLLSNPFNVISAAPHSISIITQPADSDAGAVIVGPPTVRVLDAFGNPVQGTSVTVSEDGGTVFDAGTLSVSTNSLGQAAFTDLVINTAGQYRLVFETAGVGPVNSLLFNVTPGTAQSRFRGNTHSGFISELIEDVILMDDNCTAVISLVNPAVDRYCEGETYQIRIDFTGDAPFSLTYNDGFGDVSLSGISDNPLIIDIPAVWDGLVPDKVYHYTVVSMEDNRGCTDSGSGSVEVTVFRRPVTGPMFHLPNQEF